MELKCKWKPGAGLNETLRFPCLRAKWFQAILHREGTLKKNPLKIHHLLKILNESFLSKQKESGRSVLTALLTNVSLKHMEHISLVIRPYNAKIILTAEEFTLHTA